MNRIKVRINHHPVNYNAVGLTIKTTDGEEHIFNDKIDTEDTEQMNAAFDISGSRNVPMIKMYSYLAARLPDRAKGFVKPEKETGDMLL